MPAHKASKIGVKVAVWATPTVAWLLRKLHPILDRIVDMVRKRRPLTIHTGLYDKEDLTQLIESQKHQPDSRISTETLELLAHVLTFGDKVVSDSMVPARAVRSVSADETIAPVIIEELHESGFSRFPVYKGEVGNFVGTMYLRDLVTLKHTGAIGDVMIPDVYYVHEDHPLEQVLDAFLKTQHHMFIVVNSFEEFVGIITIEDILEEILGCKIVDEFDQYDDIRAVAAHQAVAEHEKRKKDGKEMVVKPSQSKSAQVDDPATAKNPYQESTLKHLLFEAGFRGEALEIAFAVALAESAGKATAHNDDESTGDDSYGLFQINMLGAMGPERRKLYNLKANKDLFHPPTNARVAFAISQEGKDWDPWTTYVNGAYKKFYNPKSNASITK
jgi:CBS domain-containing protein